MIAAPHQKQFQLYSRPIQRALAGADAGYLSCVVDAYRAARCSTSIAHAELAPAVDEQSTTEQRTWASTNHGQTIQENVP